LIRESFGTKLQRAYPPLARKRKKSNARVKNSKNRENLVLREDEGVSEDEELAKE